MKQGAAGPGLLARSVSVWTAGRVKGRAMVERMQEIVQRVGALSRIAAQVWPTGSSRLDARKCRALERLTRRTKASSAARRLKHVRVKESEVCLPPLHNYGYCLVGQSSGGEADTAGWRTPRPRTSRPGSPSRTAARPFDRRIPRCGTRGCRSAWCGQAPGRCRP